MTLVLKCYSGGQIKENEMGRVCKCNDKEERCMQGFIGET